MEAASPIIIETPDLEKDIKDIKFVTESFNSKLNNDNYKIMIGILKNYLVIKVLNKSLMKNNYICFLTFEQLKNISKLMRYFDDIKDIISFLEKKGKKNEIFIREENKKKFIEFKIISPNGKEDLVSLELKPREKSEKELVFNLFKKVDELEKKVVFLNKEVNKNKEEIKYLITEIEKLKQERIENKEINTIFKNNQIQFIFDYLKETYYFKNKSFNLTLLYRGTRDGDSTEIVHKKCDGLKNIIIFMKTEQGNIYGI